MAAFVFDINVAMVDNLIATIEALRSPSNRELRKYPYQNRKGVWGMCFVIWHGQHYHMISISNCHRTEPQITDVADCFQRVIQIDESKWGFYDNKKGALGYYATFQSPLTFDGAGHWYMLARSNDRRTLRRMRDLPNISEDMKEMIDYVDAQGDFPLGQQSFGINRRLRRSMT